MKRASMIFLIFAVVIFVIQWMVPAMMIVGQEVVLDKGQEIKVECQPIDPYDPFRGRYVRIRLNLPLSNGVKLPDPNEYHEQQRLYGQLILDENGFARVKKITVEPPETDLHVRGKKLQRRTTFELGLDRYYMNEKLAPEAEKIVRQNIREDSTVWASLKVWKGRAVLTGIFIDGVPIEDLARKN